MILNLMQAKKSDIELLAPSYFNVNKDDIKAIEIDEGVTLQINGKNEVIYFKASLVDISQLNILQGKMIGLGIKGSYFVPQIGFEKGSWLDLLKTFKILQEKKSV